MVKFKFLSTSTLPTMAVMAEYVANQFDLDQKEALSVMQARESLGSTAITADMIMPHVELPNLTKQGLLLIQSPAKSALVLIIDSQLPDNQLISLLGVLLQSQHLAKLKQIESQQALEEFIKEVSLNAIR